MDKEANQPLFDQDEKIPDHYFTPDRGSSETIRLMQLQSSDDERARPLEALPTRITELLSFASFISSRSHLLTSIPEQLIQLARNHARDGIVAESASLLSERLTRPWIARDPRPQHHRPDRLLRIPAQCNEVAISADGRKVLIDEPNGIVLFNTLTGSLLHRFEPAGLPMAISADGSTVASWAMDLLHVWETASGLLIQTLQDDSNRVSRIALSADGSILVTDTEDAIKVWNTRSGSKLWSLKCRTIDLAMSDDGKWILTGAEDNRALVWNIESGKCVRTLVGHTSRVARTALSGNGSIGLTSDGLCQRLWDVSSGECLRSTGGDAQTKKRSDMSRIALTADGRLAMNIASGSHMYSGNRSWTISNRVCIWDTQTGETLRNPASSVIDASFTADGRILATATARSEVTDTTSYHGGCDLEIWDTRVDRNYVSSFGESAVSPSLVLTPDGKKMLAASDNDLWLYESDSREWQSEPRRKLFNRPIHTDSVSALALSPDHSIVVSGGFDCTVRVWDAKSTSCLRVFKCGDYVYDLTLSADGRFAFSASRRLSVWDLANGQCVESLSDYDSSGDITAIALTPDGTRVLTATRGDGCLRLWKLNEPPVAPPTDEDYYYESEPQQDSRLLWSLDLPDQTFRLAITPDGRTAVSGSTNGTVGVWDLVAGRCLHELKGHSSMVRGVAITPDCKTILSASEDETLRIWDLASGQCLGNYWLGKALALSSIGPTGQFALSTTYVQHLNLRCRKMDVPLITAVRLFRFGNLELDEPVEDLSVNLWDPPGLFTEGEELLGNFENEITAACPWCGIRFDVPLSVIETIDDIRRNTNLSPTDSPCLQLDAEAWDDKRLLSACPLCEGLHRFNPFIVDHGGN